MNAQGIQAEENRPLRALIGIDAQTGEAVFIELPLTGDTLLLGKASATKDALQCLLLQLIGASSPEDLQITFLVRDTETASLLRDLPYVFDLSQLPQFFEGLQMRQRRRPFILVVAEDLDTTSRPGSLELLLQVGRKWAVGVMVTASSPQLSETILANTTTQVFLPQSASSVLEMWQKRLLFTPEQEAAPGRAFLFLDGKSRWIAPVQLSTPAMQDLLRSQKKHRE